MKPTEIHTVADIRKAIDGLDDDDLVHCQLVADDGAAWAMRCIIAPVYQSQGVVIDVRHPDLKKLPTGTSSCTDE